MGAEPEIFPHLSATFPLKETSFPTHLSATCPRRFRICPRRPVANFRQVRAEPGPLKEPASRAKLLRPQNSPRAIPHCRRAQSTAVSRAACFKPTGVMDLSFRAGSLGSPHRWSRSLRIQNRGKPRTCSDAAAARSRAALSPPT